MKLSNKTAQKYFDLIKTGHMTERELINFRKAVNGSSRLPIEIVQDLLADFDAKATDKGIQLTAEQQAKGLAWLNRETFKLNGRVRKNPVLKQYERNVLQGFKKFTCVGLYDLSTNNYRHFMPIYRCVAKNGTYFDYVCKMWGEIVVIEIGDRNGCVSASNQPGFDLKRDTRPELKLVA